MRFGIILIIVGLLVLLNNIGVLTAETMNVVWPVTLIVLGAWIMIRRRCVCSRYGCWGGKSCHRNCSHESGVCEMDEKNG